MIYDKLANLHYYASTHPLFDIVCKFINNRIIRDLDIGKVNLSDGVFAIVSEYETKDIGTLLEYHNKYIDIQVMIEGEERIGISNKDECKIIDEYDELEDFANVAGSFDLITLKKNYFAIFYPQDAHLPCLKIAKEANKVKKIVFKVPV